MITATEVESNEVTLTFLSRPDVTYVVEGSADAIGWVVLSATVTADEETSIIQFQLTDGEPAPDLFRISVVEETP